MTAPACSKRAHRSGVVGRDVAFQQPRAAGGANAFGDDDVLHRDRDARQRSGIFARGQLLVHAFGRGQRAFRTKNADMRWSSDFQPARNRSADWASSHGAELARGKAGLYLLDGQRGDVD